MGVIVDPDTGRLVSGAVDKASIDAQMRVMVPAGDRVLDRDFGSSFFEALDGRPESIDSLPASIQAALVGAPGYTFVNVRVLQENSDDLRIDLSIDVDEAS